MAAETKGTTKTRLPFPPATDIVVIILPRDARPTRVFCLVGILVETVVQPLPNRTCRNTRLGAESRVERDASPNGTRK